MNYQLQIMINQTVKVIISNNLNEIIIIFKKQNKNKNKNKFINI